MMQKRMQFSLVDRLIDAWLYEPRKGTNRSWAKRFGRSNGCGLFLSIIAAERLQQRCRRYWGGGGGGGGTTETTVISHLQVIHYPCFVAILSDLRQKVLQWNAAAVHWSIKERLRPAARIIITSPALSCLGDFESSLYDNWNRQVWGHTMRGEEWQVTGWKKVVGEENRQVNKLGCQKVENNRNSLSEDVEAFFS